MRGHPSYTCHRVDRLPDRVDDGGKYGPIVVNGDLDKQVWRQAERTQRFAQMSGEVSLFNTEAAMLWDDDNVYIAFWLEEPDVRCTGQDRDGILWQENTVEVSIAGAGAYYNLSVNPRNKTSELFFIWKDAYTRGSRYDVAEFDLAIQRPMVFGGDAQPHDERGMRWGFLDWRFPGLHTAVQIDGTLNERTKVDRGWTVELALPWEGLQRLADGATPARSGDTWRLALARNEVIDQCGTRNTATWNWQPTGAPGGVPYVMHKPDRFPRVTFQ